MIYYVYAKDVNRVKIGYTAGATASRLKALKTGSPVLLVLLGTEEGDTERERQLHKQFAALRGHNEWFDYRDGLRAYIELNIMLPSKPPEDIQAWFVWHRLVLDALRTNIDSLWVEAGLRLSQEEIERRARRVDSAAW